MRFISGYLIAKFFTNIEFFFEAGGKRERYREREEWKHCIVEQVREDMHIFNHAVFPFKMSNQLAQTQFLVNFAATYRTYLQASMLV